jgi:hypothetical protein
MLAIDKDEIEVELPENVDHPWGWEGKVVAVRLASGTHGGFDSVGLLHPMSSSVRQLLSDRPILSVFGPLAAAELCTGRSESSKTRCKRRMGNGLNAPKPAICTQWNRTGGVELKRPFAARNIRRPRPPLALEPLTVIRL